MAENAKSKAPVNAQDLMETLAENIRRVVDGEITPASANAVVNSSAALLRVVKMQMDYAKATNATPHIPMLLTSGNGKE